MVGWWMNDEYERIWKEVMANPVKCHNVETQIEEFFFVNDSVFTVVFMFLR
jgi:uncharacterized Zn finger protein